jgi:uncharacterized protein
MLLFDASALVSLFIPSNATARIKEYVRLNEPVIGLSDVAAGEFASAVAMRVRTLNLSAEQGQKVLTVFDSWIVANTEAVATETMDIRLAATFVRRFDLKLRLPNALYLATAQRLSVPLITFDVAQADAAKALGIALHAPGIESPATQTGTIPSP